MSNKRTPVQAMIAARRLVRKPPERIRKQSRRDKLKAAIEAFVADEGEMAAVAAWSSSRNNTGYDVEFRALAKHLGSVVRAINSVPTKQVSTVPEGNLRVLGTVANLATRLGRPAKMAEMARHVARKQGGNYTAVLTQLKRIDRSTLAWFNRVPSSDHDRFIIRLSCRLAEAD